MRKGQVLPTATGKSTDEPARGRGMLPPSGTGPIEVTREADATAVHLSEEIRRELQADLPESGEPAEIIVACEKRIHAAGVLLEAMETKALTSYFHFAGPAVRLAWSSESWRSTVDTRTDKPCRSWSAWLRMIGVSRQHAYRMTKEQPIKDALRGLEPGKLGVRQIDVLSPVLNQFGPQEVRRLWTAAMGWGDTGAASLLRLRDQLGIQPDKVVSEGSDPENSGDTSPILKFQMKPGVFDASLVRQVARTQPQISLLVAQEIFAELGIEIPGK